jgi:carbamoyl-phosphate synthase large subunit
MKATGEVMAIDRSFEAALLKAIRGLEVKAKDLTHPRFANDVMSDDALREAIRVPTDERLWAVAEGLRRGWTVEEVSQICRIDPWFLNKIKGLVGTELAAAPDKVSYKMVDTCAGEFESATPYFYATGEETSDEVQAREADPQECPAMA